MSSFRSHHRAHRLALVLLVVVLVAVGCGNSSDDDAAGASSDTTVAPTASGGTAPVITGVPGVTDTEIRFAGLGTDSNNPTGTCYLKCFLDGVKAYFAYRNSQGGIYGRKLVISKSLDDELGKNQQSSLEIISAKDTFGVFDAPILGTGYEDFNRAKIPVYTYLTDPAKGVMMNLFGSPPPSCVSCTRIDNAYAVKATGAKQVGALGYAVPSSATCAKGVADTVEKYSADIGGAKVAYQNVSLPYGLPNGVAPEVTAMKNAGVDLIFTCLDQNGVKTFAQEIKRQGMKDAVIFQTSSYDSDFVKTNASVYEGAIMLTNIRPHEATPSTGRKLFETWMAKSGATISTENSAHGWVLADLAYQGLERAGPQFDRQKVIDATNAINDFTAGGLLPPWDVGRQHEIPTQDDPATHGAQPFCFVLLEIHNGDATFLKPATAEKPYLCWPGTTRDWSEPEAMSFK